MNWLYTCISIILFPTLIHGAGFPTSGNITWTFEKVGSHPTNVAYGDKMSYKVTMHWPAKTSDVLIEIYTASSSEAAQFSICSPTISVVGSNFENIDNTTKNDMWKLEAKGNDYRYERAVLNLTGVKNTGADSANDAPNQVEFSFDSIVLNSPNMTTSTNYYVSFGVRYDNNEKVWVGQAAYTWVNNTIEAWGNNTYSLSGPSSLRENEMGFYTVTLVLRNMLNQIIMDVFAPLNTTDIMSICHVGIPATGVGNSYACHPKENGLTYPKNVTYNTATGETHNAIATIDLGEVINTNKRSGLSSDENDTLIIKIAAKMLNGSSLGDIHKIGVALQYNSATIWVSSVNTTLSNDSWTAPATTPTFSAYTTMDTVRVNSNAPLFFNMTIPQTTSTNYKLEVALPFNNSQALMSYERIRILHVGKNIKCYYYSNDTITAASSANDSNKDYVTFDMGVVSNIGMFDGTYDNVIVVEVVSKVLNHSLIADGGDTKVVFGIRYGNAIWVSSLNYTISTVQANYTTAKTPTFSLKSMQTEKTIYNGSGHSFWLEGIFPIATQYDPLKIEVITVMDNNRALLSICDVRVLEVGEHFVGITTDTLTIQKISTADDKYIDRLLITFPNIISNLGRFDYDWEKLKNTIRLQITAHVTDHDLINSTNLVNSSEYWIGASVKFTPDKLWVGRSSISYDSTTMFDNITSLNQATFSKSNISTTTNIYVGGAHAYKINMQSIAQTKGHYIFDAVSLNKSLHVCRVGLKKRGINVPCLSPMTNEQRTILNTSDSQTSGVKLDLYNFANTGLANYQNTNENNTGEFDVVVQLKDGFEPITAGDTYMIASVVYMGTTKLWVDGNNLTPDMGNPSTSFTPEFNLDMRNSSTIIIHGGSAVVQLEVWIPAGSLGTYTVDFIVPWNETDKGKLHICSIRVISSGWNVPCINDTYLDRTFNDSNNMNFYDKAQIRLGSVPNIATSGDTRQEDNKVVIEAEIFNNENLSNVGDSLFVAAIVNITGNAVWVGSKSITVSNTLPPVTNIKPIFAAIPPSDNTTLEIFEEKEFKVNVTFPEVVTNFTLTVYATTSQGESTFTFSDLNITQSGNNYCCMDKVNVSYTNSSTYSTSQIDRIMAQFILTNTGTFRRYQWGEYHKNSDWIEFSVKARLTDHPANINGAIQMINFQMEYSGETKTATTPVTVIAEQSNVPDLQIISTVQNLNLTQKQPGSVVELSLQVNHTNASKANAYDVDIFWYLPYVTTFGTIIEWTGMMPNITNNGNDGIVISYQKLMYSDNVTAKINITLDPNGVLPKSADSKIITIPLDGRYKYRMKENGIFTWTTSGYTTTIRSEIEFYNPECYDALGMASGTIKDCQIRASSEDTTDTAIKSRYNSASAWTSVSRGMGFNKVEYLEISLGNLTKLTAVTLQTKNGDATAKVTNFTMQYSDEGLLWLDVKVNGTNNTKMFQATYSGNEAYIKLGDAVTARYIRIFPEEGSSTGGKKYSKSMRLELHGCVVTSDTSANDACFPTKTVDADYKTRGLLLINDNGAIVFVCITKKVGLQAHCSSSRDFGNTWRELHSIISYITFYNSDTKELFGISQNLNSKLKSTDNGWTWLAIPESEYATNKAITGPTKTEAKVIPFDDHSAGTSSSLLPTYGFSLNTTHKVSITMGGVMFSTDSGATYVMKSFWGTADW